MNAGALVLCLCLSFSIGEPPRDPWFSEDKLMHFAASFAATTLAASAARSAGLDRGGSTVAGAIAAGGVGVWKEIEDHRRPGGFFSTRDLVWDAAGIAAAALLMQRTR
jgi:uncharacterized protein YfiM (DUF2279 family)